jgi:uncharacterized membrane protein YeaQ/YmgE (transglycosylase-associated protein family)
MSWRRKAAAGILGGFLSLILSAFAARTRISPLLLGIALGILGAFVAAYLMSAVANGLLRKSAVVRIGALLVLPPIGSFILIAINRDMAISFTFSSMITYSFCYGLIALQEASARGP